MGWWDTGILGGDTPLDYLASIEATLELGVALYPLGELSAADRDAVRGALVACDFNDLVAQIAFTGQEDIAVQVVGVAAMATGAPLGTFADQVIAAAEADQWAKEDAERAERIGELIAAVRAYDGTPTLLHERGLFEQILGGMAAQAAEATAAAAQRAVQLADQIDAELAELTCGGPLLEVRPVNDTLVAVTGQVRTADAALMFDAPQRLHEASALLRELAAND